MTTLNRAIFGGFKQLGIADDDDRRAFCARVTGEPRISLMSDAQREAVLAEQRRLGFRPKPAKVAGKYSKILQALWKAGWNLGVIKDRTDAALNAWVVDRQTDVAAVRFVHHADDGSPVVDGLKAWLSREAAVVWSNADLTKISPQRALGFKVAWAQWAILHPRGDHLFYLQVNDILNRDEQYRGHTDAEWITVMNYLGKQVRAARKAGAK